MSETDKPASVGVVGTRCARIPLPTEGFRLECGQSLPELTVAYETYGVLSPERDNVVFLCHALSGSAHAAGRHDPEDETGPWWDDMVGPGKGIDTRYYHVICANILGGCKGTTGPSSTDPRTGRPYGSSFPPITVGDIVSVHRQLLLHLGIERLAAVVGGSFGGMQAMEWTIRYPEMITHAICIASAAALSTQALAFDIVGRHSIMSDPNWQGGDYYGTGRQPADGLAQARKIGHITYLSPEMMSRKFGRERREDRPAPADEAPLRTAFHSDFQVESYLDHQGRKFVQRFDANSYLHITRAMDEYDLRRRHGSLDAAFAPIRARLLVVALSSDWLFPPEQSMEVANALLRAGKRVSYCQLHAPHGHDAFLVDIEHLAEAIRAFLPWVGPAPEGTAGGTGRRERRPTRTEAAARTLAAGYRRSEYEIVMDMIRPGSRVLDLGCGDGSLLGALAAGRGTVGLGVDIDIANVIDVIDRGHDVFQADIDAGLAMIPDGAYDYAVLSETLQVVRKPLFVLREMLRAAREGIVVFPNFGKWDRRLQLLRAGRMPKGGSLPFEWYDTPNIHLFTHSDFIDLCRADGMDILDMVCIPAERLGRWLIRLRCCNAGADRVIVNVAPHRPGIASGKPSRGGHGTATCVRCRRCRP